MQIIVVGLNHKTAPVELRERVSVSDIEIDEVLNELRDRRTLLESVLLSTCNRTEVYAIVSSNRAGEDYLQSVLAKRAGLSQTEFAPHLYVKTGEQAVRHLFRVVTGLDSLVIGETQILGQVRNAFLCCSDAGCTGALLNQVFRLAIQLGKRAQTETTIGQNPVSVSYAAVQLAKKIFGNLSGRSALVLGAGKMSALTAQHLVSNGIGQLWVANRTLERAEQVALELGGQAVPWNEVSRVLEEVDVVISSTGANEYVLNTATVAPVASKRGHQPVAYIDIAVPRDLDPGIGDLKNVYLYDIDDLEGVVAANLAEREREAKLVEVMIQDSILDFSTWLAEQEVVPLVAAIREKGTAIQASVMESLNRKLPNLTDRERKMIHKHTMSIVNQILRDPIQNMKELAIASGGAKHVEVFAQLFGVTEDILAHASSEHMLALPHTETENMGFVELVRQWKDSFLQEKEDVAKPLLHPVLR